MLAAPKPFRPSDISVRVVKSLLQPYARKKLLLPLLLFFVDGAVYGGLVVGAVMLPEYWQRLLCGALAGLAIGMLFVVGHDACHGSYTKHGWLNKIIGRIAFLPSLHAFSLWNLGHNQIHHRFTNLRAEDYVWRPFSKEEFDRLPQFRQGLERFYRSILGFGLYYAVEIWWKKLVFPNSREVPEKKAVYLLDSLLVTGFACLQVAFAVWLGLKVGLEWYASVAYGCVLPFAVWNWLSGFFIFQHHTHPSVAWFDEVDDWRYLESQIEGTTHIRFPRGFALVLHNIMEHTAHHALPNIPLYNLRKAQLALEESFSGRVKVVNWTMRGFFNTVRNCKLYDYGLHVWTDFDGMPTSEPTVVFEQSTHNLP